MNEPHAMVAFDNQPNITDVMRKASSQSSTQPKARKRASQRSSQQSYEFVGQVAAFSCASPAGEMLNRSFGKKWIKEAICYSLEKSQGHIIGSVTWLSKGKSDTRRYDVAWECSALGESAIVVTFISDTCVAGCQLMSGQMSYSSAW